MPWTEYTTVKRHVPHTRTAGRTIAPLLAGAVATAAGGMLLGWPDRPPLPGRAGEVAAAALMTVAVLLVFVPAVPARRAGASDVARDRLVAAGAHADGAHRRTGQLLDPQDVRACTSRELVEGPAGREVLEPAG